MSVIPSHSRPSVRSGFDRAFIVRWALGGGAFLLALLVNCWTGMYVDRIGPALAPAQDLLFQHLPFMTFPIIHAWGFVAFLAVFNLGVLLYDREKAPYFLWAYALIVTTRAFFTVLTPLGMPLQAPTFEHYSLRFLFQYFDFRHTFFFSGHTAFPFMGFFLASRAWVRWSCLAVSLLLASSVLMSRLHYSIDVGAAFFITYAVARLARRSWRTLLRTLSVSAQSRARPAPVNS